MEMAIKMKFSRNNENLEISNQLRRSAMDVQRTLRTPFVFPLAAFVLLAWILMDPVRVAAGFIEGSKVFWIEGDREEIFNRVSTAGCPASAATDKNTWITVNSATLNGTNAKAAIVFGHAFAQQDDIAFQVQDGTLEV